MLLTRSKYYFFLLLLCLSPFVLYKVGWLAISKPAVGKVLYIDETYGRKIGRQEYPVVEFQTEKYVVTVSGNYNLNYNKGADYPIRYNRFKETDTRLNTFLGLWIDTLIWCSIFATTISLTFIAKGIVPRRKLVAVSFTGIRFIDKESCS